MKFANKIFLIFASVSIFIMSCKDEAAPPAPAPDPLADAAGSYLGNVEENGKIIPNVTANVITMDDGNKKLYISSIGLASKEYQLVLNNGRGSRNGFQYRSQAQIKGKVVNISGKYSYILDSPNYPQNNFSFTGIKL